MLYNCFMKELKMQDKKYYSQHRCICKSVCCARSGVSNKRPAGRMWPAGCVCAARNIIKITQIIAKTTIFAV